MSSWIGSEGEAFCSKDQRDFLLLICYHALQCSLHFRSQDHFDKNWGNNSRYLMLQQWGLLSGVRGLRTWERLGVMGYWRLGSRRLDLSTVAEGGRASRLEQGLDLEHRPLV